MTSKAAQNIILDLSENFCREDFELEALEMAWEALENEWISVKEELPQKYNSVLVYLPANINIATAYLGNQEQWWLFHASPPQKITEPITHWMPLPKPPDE